MDKKQSTFAKQLAILRVGYLAGLSVELAAMQAMASSLRGGERDREQLNLLYQQLHKLTGSSGTFGLPALSEASRKLERRAKGWLAGDLNGVDATLCRAFAAALAALDVPGLTTLDTSAVARDPKSALTPSAPLRAPGNSIVVWLVEEDTPLRQQLQHQLDAFNFPVRVFTDIDQAECAAHTECPDIMITSVLFDATGSELNKSCERYPALNALGCPLVFVTTTDDFQSRVRAARLRAVGCFIKPVDIPRLINLIGKLIEDRLAPPLRVLIVDDDKDFATHCNLVLCAAGMQVQVLQAPETLIEVLSAFQPELILMDVNMPGYTGPELARVIRQYDQWNSLPIVYLSAETDLEQQISAMNSGGDDFLVKPISNVRLVAAVHVRVQHARQLAEQINKDSLTGLLKHARIKEVAANEVRRAQRIDKPVTLAMLDIDHFKSVNDAYGHAAGDVVISALAALLRQRLRRSDHSGRYGGEEFLVVLPGCTSVEAQWLLDDIRQRFAGLQFTQEGEIFSCSLSAGHATLLDAVPVIAGKQSALALDEANLLDAADAALYEAKRGGRNRVCGTHFSQSPPQNHNDREN